MRFFKVRRQIALILSFLLVFGNALLYVPAMNKANAAVVDPDTMEQFQVLDAPEEVPSQVVGLPGGKTGVAYYVGDASTRQDYYRVVDAEGQEVFDLNITDMLPADRKISDTNLLALSNGNSVFTWDGIATGCGEHFQFVIIDSTGDVVKEPTNITEDPDASYNCTTTVTELTNGNILFTWQHESDDYMLRIFTSDGQAVTNAVSIDKTGSRQDVVGYSGSFFHGVAANGNGTFMITYYTNSSEYYYGVIYNDDGTQKTVNGFNHFKISDSKRNMGISFSTVAALKNNNYVVLSETEDGVHLKIFNDQGAAIGSELTSGTSLNTPPNVGIHGLLSLKEGGFIIADVPEVAAAGNKIIKVKEFGNNGVQVADWTSIDNVSMEDSYWMYAIDTIMFKGFESGFGFLNDVTGMLTLHGMPESKPVSNADTYTTSEDTALTVSAPGVLSNDTDPEGDPLTAVLASNTSHGTLAFNTNGSFTYTPEANYSGTDSFSYRASDGNGTSDIAAIVSLIVTAVNDAPTIGTNAGLTVAEGGTALIGNERLEALDVDTAGGSLTYTLKTAPSNGVLRKNGTPLAVNGIFTQADINSGLISYMHSGSETTSDGFTVDVSDGQYGVTNIAFAITITAVNDAPIAVADAHTLNEDQTLTVTTANSILLNDTDNEGNTLTAVLVSGVSHGSLTLNADGTFTYTAVANYVGSDSFTYMANDGTSNSNVATVTLTVSAVNDAPAIGTNAGLTVAENGTGVIGTMQLEALDVDTAAANLTYTLKAAPSNGVLRKNGIELAVSGTFTQVDINSGLIDYVHDGSETTSDGFTVDVSDGQYGVTNIAFAITVTAVNDAPVAVSDVYSLNEDQPLTVTAANSVLANDLDIDGDSLTAVLVSDVTHGTLTFNQDGSFTYTPAANYAGGDSFTYRASDATTNSNAVTVSLTVAAVNDAPTIGTNAGLTVEESGTVVINPAQLEALDVDTAAANLTYRLSAAPTNGVLRKNGIALALNGTFTQEDMNSGLINYVHDGSETTSDSVTVGLSDGEYMVNGIVIAIVVTPVNDAPVAQNKAFTTKNNKQLTIAADKGLLVAATDGEHSTLTASKISDPANGTVTVNADGSFRYTPVKGYVGIDSFTYVLNDGELNSDPAIVTITVKRETPPQQPKKEWININDGTKTPLDDPSLIEVTIERETDADGVVRDQVNLKEEEAKQAVTKGGKKVILYIPDPEDKVSETKVNIAKKVHRIIADGGAELQIWTENVRLHLSALTMQMFEGDMYFHFVPVKDEAAREAAERNVKQNSLIRTASMGKDVRIIGRPMEIDTNLENRPVMLVLPLREGVPADAAERERFLDSLVIFIEHDDGTKELIQGNIVEYDDNGTIGIAFAIDRFSTFTLVSMEGWSAYLADQEGKTYHEAYMKGYGDGTFRPNGDVTRAEVAALLYRLMKLDSGAGSANVFTDVPATHWAVKEINAVAAAGIMTGYEGGTFHPGSVMTRAEMAAVLAKWKQLELVEAGEGEASLTDIKGHWAQAYIEAVQEEGWMNGYPGGVFKPNNELTRAEATAIMNRVTGRGPLEGIDQSPWKDVSSSHWAYGHILEASVDHMFVVTNEGEVFRKVGLEL
ncbi:tandem-95 repeat protein [Paenibacillus sp. YIM B09110]|uniref:tandem-95 repeat protein n=1 Tax=Paenibacillus sp. YIM B09110 TaxID=3126102 RepID=UPI00301DB0E6